MEFNSLRKLQIEFISLITRHDYSAAFTDETYGALRYITQCHEIESMTSCVIDNQLKLMVVKMNYIIKLLTDCNQLMVFKINTV